MILIIDNYDSFTYNLYQYVGSINSDIKVVRNDKMSVREVGEMSPSHIIISPGPGFPNTAGISIDVIKTFCSTIPILGVCLGHQAIGEAFGGKIVHAVELYHGKSSEILLEDCEIFKGLPRQIQAARYHSLIVEKASLPPELKIIASTYAGEIMGVRHKEYPVYGIQFHPESIITEYGMDMISNFLSI
ncbi:aminodeoxychorismate/anthranilate synthase component II [Petroclostridium sp. X23]|uniref:anthranilate synthase component II n=1 Tax=Petroclostridium sp. X23 TaxID=3045146 RepID=UPI0024AE009B|nr:aminodeoxychorismate/anthranilate synthase component II [Petroclostridium sp. X23]WHH59601.1 aminodeoxychorismate/anthranilate synthase component II [Petroclostridium sp. X23]